MFNEAQHILLSIGADPYALLFGAWKRPASAHHTKAGPGRRHGGKLGSRRLRKPFGPGTYAENDYYTTLRLTRRHYYGSAE